MTVSSVICISGCVYEFPQSVDLCCGHAHAYLGAPDPLSAFTHTCCGAGPGLVLGVQKPAQVWSVEFGVVLRSHLCMTGGYLLAGDSLGRPSLGHLRGAGEETVSQGDQDRPPSLAQAASSPPPQAALPAPEEIGRAGGALMGLVCSRSSSCIPNWGSPSPP